MSLVTKNIVLFIARRPFLSFVLGLFVLFAIIFASSKMRAVDEVSIDQGIGEKVVDTVRVGDGRYTQLSGKIEKDGIVTIVAQVSGIVHGIYVDEGQTISTGQQLMYLADTYGGGSSAAVGYQIATRQSEGQDETFDKQESVIDDQRNDVPKTDNVNASIARKQFTIQKRNAELAYDVTKLQQKQAAVGAARYAPTSPFAGTVDRVFVSRGDTVGLGQRLAVINGDEQRVNLTVNISTSLASMIDVTQPSVIMVGDQKIEMLPQYLSRGIADDQSFVLTYVINQQYTDLFVDNSFVDVSVPVETQVSDEHKILIPIDAVRLMSNKAVIFVVEGGIARSRAVVSGDIVGGFIFVSGEIAPDDHIIIDRNVFDGDPIIVAQS